MTSRPRTWIFVILIAASCAAGCTAILGNFEKIDDTSDPHDTSELSDSIADDSTDAAAKDEGGDASADAGSDAADGSDTRAATDSAGVETADAGPTDAGLSDAPVDIVFPKTSDTRVIVNDPNMWHAGDYLQGSRATSLPSVSSFSGTFMISNTLWAGTGAPTIVLNIYINDVKIGMWTIAQYSGTSVSIGFTFAPISGPNYVIKFVETNTLTSSDGWISPVFDVSHWEMK